MEQYALREREKKNLNVKLKKGGWCSNIFEGEWG